MMRRGILLVLLAATGLLNTSCIIVLGVDDLTPYEHVVEIDGELYVVNKESRQLERLGSAIIVEEAEKKSSSPTE